MLKSSASLATILWCKGSNITTFDTLHHYHILWIHTTFCEIVSIGGCCNWHISISQEPLTLQFGNLVCLYLYYTNICSHLLKFHLACLTKWLPMANQNSAGSSCQWCDGSKMLCGPQWSLLAAIFKRIYYDGVHPFHVLNVVTQT